MKLSNEAVEIIDELTEHPRLRSFRVDWDECGKGWFAAFAFTSPKAQHYSDQYRVSGKDMDDVLRRFRDGLSDHLAARDKEPLPCPHCAGSGVADPTLTEELEAEYADDCPDARNGIADVDFAAKDAAGEEVFG